MKKKSFHDCLTFEDSNQSYSQLSLFGDDSHPQESTPANRRPKTEGGVFKKSPKAQISTIPGTSPKQRDRYRVVLGGQILGERLSIDEAIALAKTGSNKFNHSAK